MMHPELAARVAERFAALADESRLRLLMRLRRGPCNVTALTRELGIAQASCSKHLGVLRRAGLVEATRHGTQALYRVRDQSIFDMCKHVCDGVIRHMRAEQAMLRAFRSSGSTGAGSISHSRKAKTA